MSDVRTPMGAALARGVDTISINQTITFNRYTRLVLPADGYVFWVKDSILSPSALLNTSQLNTFQLNAPSAQTDATSSVLVVPGSLHYATDARQEEEASYSTNRVVFTSENEVQDLNEIAPNKLWLASFDGIRFAFSSRGSYYEQANLWHYVGDAVYSIMESQIIDDPRLFNSGAVIVSNSLPSWLALNGYNPPWPVPLPMPRVLLYPSFLSPDNIAPPFGTIHIESSESQQGAQLYDANYNQSSLTKDRVSVTLYGFNNNLAQTFLSAVAQYSFDNPDRFGIMNMPVIRDEKQIQPEISAIAQKKKIIFDVSYNQGQQRALAQQLIESAFIDVVGIENAPINIEV